MMIGLQIPNFRANSIQDEDTLIQLLTPLAQLHWHLQGLDHGRLTSALEDCARYEKLSGTLDSGTGLYFSLTASKV
jgi:hypothetical protein